MEGHRNTVRQKRQILPGGCAHSMHRPLEQNLMTTLSKETEFAVAGGTRTHPSRLSSTMCG